MNDPRFKLLTVHKIRLVKSLDAYNNNSKTIAYHKHRIMMINCAIRADRVFALFWIGVYLGV